MILGFADVLFSILCFKCLEDKLTSVENEYREKEKLAELDKKLGLEEKLIAMQKKYEVQKKNELEEEVLYIYYL